MKPRLTVVCAKHGEQRGLPMVREGLRPYEDWPDDVADETKYPRVCVKCLAESMVSPVRRSSVVGVGTQESGVGSAT